MKNLIRAILRLRSHVLSILMKLDSTNNQISSRNRFHFEYMNYFSSKL